MHVMGIDAGGTKTVCLLADESGRVLAEARDGGANLQSAGELEVEKVLHRVMEAALARYDESCGTSLSGVQFFSPSVKTSVFPSIVPLRRLVMTSS